MFKVFLATPLCRPDLQRYDGYQSHVSMLKIVLIYCFLIKKAVILNFIQNAIFMVLSCYTIMSDVPENPKIDTKSSICFFFVGNDIRLLLELET